MTDEERRANIARLYDGARIANATKEALEEVARLRNAAEVGASELEVNLPSDDDLKNAEEALLQAAKWFSNDCAVLLTVLEGGGE